jgi:hypothetical protein
MSRRVSILSAVLVALAGLGAYTATVTTRSTSQPATSSDDATEALLSWLNASADQRSQLRQADAGFASELKQLKANVAANRAVLASLLEKPEATNDQIMVGLEKVIAANNALERRVAKYLLSVREHLTIEQQRRLLNLCAEEVRHGRGYQWGRQQGGHDTDVQPGRGRHGRGPGGGGPPGRSRGN